MDWLKFENRPSSLLNLGMANPGQIGLLWSFIYIILNSPCPIYQHLSMAARLSCKCPYLVLFSLYQVSGEVPDKEILENEQLWAQCSEPCYFFIYIKLVISSLQIWRVLFYHSIYCLLMIHSKFLCLLMVFLNAYLPPNCT